MVTIKKTRSELKREAIVNAAKKAFVEHGVQGISMDKLSELAQVSKRTVYNHFATKEELVMHIMSDLWRRATTQIEREYSCLQPLQDQLVEILTAEAHMFSSQENIDLSRVAIGYFFYKPDALEREMAKFSSRETTLYKWLEAAVADGRLKPLDFEFANSQLHNLIKGRCFWPLLINAKQRISDQEIDFVVSEAAAMFINHYKAEG
ncbi:transcriptional regulator [Vibrio sp. MACH09]|uniref:TetR/AcrR family transcriptional regulator n=1 Tax=Vibrio sp. MACH09 TaxID=3025122 RepID=UPI00278CD446|nr:TetR/AcrR family transcriptional regulator [Vibrio sp. MACH09]GLO61331.1 transcriptional regulator [Vibrio sp. MACH09]